MPYSAHISKKSYIQNKFQGLKRPPPFAGRKMASSPPDRRLSCRILNLLSLTGDSPFGLRPILRPGDFLQAGGGAFQTPINFKKRMISQQCFVFLILGFLKSMF